MNVPLNRSTFGEEEIQAAIEVLRSGMVTMGSRCFDFENQFAQFIGSKNAIFVNSGSSANLLAFFALANPEFQNGKFRRLTPGSEVLVPAVTWSTSVWPIVQAGGIPVLVDSDPETLQLKLESVERCLSPKTVGICAVHVLGNAVDMKPLQDIADRNGLWILEDTCESLGTYCGKKRAGTLGIAGTYSFFFSHHITTIEGGMIVTDNDEFAELLRCLRAHGWTRHLKNRKEIESRYPDLDPRFLFVNTGFNVRPTEINAAFGVHQLRKLDGFNSRRVEITSHWRDQFKGLTDAGHFQIMKAAPNTEPTWFGFPIVCKTPELRRALQSHLESNGIETRPIIAGNLARQPAFEHVKHRRDADLSGADKIMECGLFWGSHPIMNKNEIDHVTNVVTGFFKK